MEFWSPHQQEAPLITFQHMGPIIPLSTQLLALTPSVRFVHADGKELLPAKQKIRFDILDADSRPVSATADDFEVRNITSVNIQQSTDLSRTLMFSSGQSLEERILKEQFAW